MESWKESIGGLAGKPVARLGKPVRDIMRRGVPTCRLETTAAAIVRQMATGRLDALAVVDAGGEVVGLITDREVTGCYMANLEELTAENIMLPRAPVVAPETLVVEAVHVMRDRGVRHLLIKGEERREVPVGIVSAMDIVREMAGLPPDRLERKPPAAKGGR